MEPERQAKSLYVKHSKTVVWKQYTNASIVNLIVETKFDTFSRSFLS